MIAVYKKFKIDIFRQKYKQRQNARYPISVSGSQLVTQLRSTQILSVAKVKRLDFHNTYTKRPSFKRCQLRCKGSFTRNVFTKDSQHLLFIRVLSRITMLSSPLIHIVRFGSKTGLSGVSIGGLRSDPSELTSTMEKQDHSDDLHLVVWDGENDSRSHTHLGVFIVYSSR